MKNLAAGAVMTLALAAFASPALASAKLPTATSQVMTYRPQVRVNYFVIPGSKYTGPEWGSQARQTLRANRQPAHPYVAGTIGSSR
jgi:hypothetical protein